MTRRVGFKAEGIIIKRLNFGEADKLLTIFTKQYGKIVVLAKGIRRIQSRRAPHLELFNLSSIFLNRGKTFDIVTEAQTIRSFSYLRLKLERIAYAYRITEEIDRLCPVSMTQRDVYQLILKTFNRMDNNQMSNTQAVAEEFSLQLLWQLGFLPREKSLIGHSLQRFLEEVIERQLISSKLLIKLGSNIES